MGADEGRLCPTFADKHMRRGFEAGRAALDSEETAYRKELTSQ
jgi:hypothetical protein